MSAPISEKIQNLITSSPVFVFMKGNPNNPMCGFSANTVRILEVLDVPFKSFDILSDPDIRQGVKEFSQWPTYPQIYFQGKLIGGNDILMAMYESGELATLLKQ